MMSVVLPSYLAYFYIYFHYTLRVHEKQGLLFQPNLKDDIQCYVDVDWAGNWMRKNQMIAPVSYCTQYILSSIQIALSCGGPICNPLWPSVPQRQNLLHYHPHYVKSFTYNISYRNFIHTRFLFFTKPHVHCQTFGDNAACIEVASSNAKIHPHTKHIAV